ncbi:uncharacterized protein MONBRDRAFT_32632 [Monosiga brevicollis MX1]|uniref:DEP domain-containing protein n=1 Tax=Monosiga brevicollis TaxID=81824 RepID=A9V0T5_MONBE|nr:uncharacterized protein MONBRDRAFT_32632 [Monosiga brevicollis MX1]EDQ88810.1 predicted protein [Monosiga brevicollis MX1]|eukprot:XP_001746423.1 hypothetical protein [Monosiga brevicollis MX1]
MFSNVWSSSESSESDSDEDVEVLRPGNKLEARGYVAVTRDDFDSSDEEIHDADQPPVGLATSPMATPERHRPSLRASGKPQGPAGVVRPNQGAPAPQFDRHQQAALSQAQQLYHNRRLRATGTQPTPAGPSPRLNPEPQGVVSRGPVTSTESNDVDSSTRDALDNYARQLMDPTTGIATSTKRIRLQAYRNVFTGADAAGWFMANMEGVATLKEAQEVGQQLIDVGIIKVVRSGSDAPGFVVSDTALFAFRARAGTMDGIADSAASRPGSARPASARSTRVGRSRVGSAASVRSNLSVLSLESTMGHRFDDEAANFASSPPLHAAAAQGDLVAIKQLLPLHFVDELDLAGRTPLMYAVLTNKPRVLRTILLAGADLNQQDDKGNTALIWATCRGAREAVKILLKEGADVELTDQEQRSALHWACKIKRVDMLATLLPYAFKAILDLQDQEGLSALHWAVLCQREEHLILLLERGADPRLGDRHGRTALHYSITQRAQACFTRLLSECPEVLNLADAQGRTPLHVAVAEAPLTFIAALLSQQPLQLNPADDRGTTPLHWACVSNRTEACQALLAAGADANICDHAGKTPLQYAIEKSNAACVALLQQHAQATRR